MQEYNTRTDLAYESFERIPGDKALYGIEKEERSGKGFVKTTIKIKDDSAAEALSKPKGRYVTWRLGPMGEGMSNMAGVVKSLADEIFALAGETGGTVLVIGLGNSGITPDSLGPRTAKRVFATRHIVVSQNEDADILNSTAVFLPGVLGDTGIDTVEHISAVVKMIAPSSIIAIDALAASNISRVGTTIQLSDTGITPGSGAYTRKNELSRATAGVPVVSIGVPTIVDAAAFMPGLFKDYEEKKQYFITPKDIDSLIENAAKVISGAINRALQPALSADELASLTS